MGLLGIKKPTGETVGKDHFKSGERERKTDKNYKLGPSPSPGLLQLLTGWKRRHTRIYKFLEIVNTKMPFVLSQERHSGADDESN